MAHQRLAHFLHHSGFEKAGIAGVPEVMEARVANTRAADGSLPGGFDPVDRCALEGEDRSGCLPPGFEVLEEPFGERNLATLATGGLRVGDVEQPTREVDVLPTLAK